MNRMEPLIGLIIGIGAIVIGNLLEGGTIQSLIQVTAFCIVMGGTLGATILSNRWSDLQQAIHFLKDVFTGNEDADRTRIAKEIISSAQLARRESILAIEPIISKFSDPFMRSVYRTAIDGVDENVLRKLFTEEITVLERRKMNAAKVWSDAGGFAPTIGIIGAVLGLIHVMANITDTAELARGIAVAFVATVYGVGSANLIFIPIANKLKAVIRHRTETEHMILEGALAVIGGLNPYLIEQKMRSFSFNLGAEQTL